MKWSYSVRRRLVMPVRAISHAEPGSGGLIDAEVAARVRLERLADAPAPRLAVRVDVREDAQEPRALHRVRRKRVDVQARVVLAPAAHAAGDVGRPERRVAAAQVAAVVREEAQRERLALLGEAHDHRAQRLQVVGGADGAAQLARRPAHRDVLRLDVGPARIEEAPLARRRARTRGSGRRARGRPRRPSSTPRVGPSSPTSGRRSAATMSTVAASVDIGGHRKARAQRTRSPGSAPACGSRTNRPGCDFSSACEAASTMPSLTPNFILRGARLATSTVSLPTSCSGE